MTNLEKGKLSARSLVYLSDGISPRKRIEMSKKSGAPQSNDGLLQLKYAIKSHPKFISQRTTEAGFHPFARFTATNGQGRVGVKIQSKSAIAPTPDA